MAKTPLNLFSLGARGYYENPTSDLLAFYLQPKSEHGLNDTFLLALFESMNVSTADLRLQHIQVEREVKTRDRKSIDIQITGPDWCLLVENKIRHREENPFISYEQHAGSLRKTHMLFCILSPSGKVMKEGKNKDWRGVSYKRYISLLQSRLSENPDNTPPSKWLIFAREFIEHIAQELYTQTMITDQLSFVEQHIEEIKEIRNLSNAYTDHIVTTTERRLEETLPGIKFKTVSEDWPHCTLVVRAKSEQWGETDMVLFRQEGPENKFVIRTYLEDMSEPRFSIATKIFGLMTHDTEGKYPFWTSLPGYDSSDAAIAGLCDLAKSVNELLKATPPQPPQ